MKDSKVQSIQGLRGIAAIIVFFEHAFYFFKSDFFSYLKETPFHLFFDGRVAVMLFFLISGFFYCPPRQKSNRKFEIPYYIKGIIKKWIRIYPVFWIVMLFAFIGSCLQFEYNHDVFTGWCNNYWARPLPFTDFLKQMTIYLPYPPEYINPPIWYMKIETKMILLGPIIAWLLYSKSRWISFPLLFFVFIDHWEFICFFVIGMMVHYLSDKYRDILEKRKWIYPVVILAILMLNIQNEFLYINSQLADLIRSLGGGLLLLIVYVRDPKFMGTPKIVYMGNISYEFYLVHFVILLYMRPLYGIGCTFYIVMGFVISFVFAVILNKFNGVVARFSKSNFKRIYE